MQSLCSNMFWKGHSHSHTFTGNYFIFKLRKHLIVLAKYILDFKKEINSIYILHITKWKLIFHWIHQKSGGGWCCALMVGGWSTQYYLPSFDVQWTIWRSKATILLLLSSFSPAIKDLIRTSPVTQHFAIYSPPLKQKPGKKCSFIEKKNLKWGKMWS